MMHKAAMERMIVPDEPAVAKNLSGQKSGTGGADARCNVVAEPLNRTVYLLGGIQINMPFGEDFFMPLVFKKYALGAVKSDDLLDATFSGASAAIADTPWGKSKQVVNLDK